jgi:SAM-dependent methyltransferase
MKAGRPPANPGLAGREERADLDSQAREALRLFDVKAAGWAVKYAPGGALVGRLAGLSIAVSRCTQAEDRVLDLGCGTGDLARVLAAAGLQVAGCDISGEMLVRAAREPRGRGGCAGWVRLSPGWRRLPFASAAFDVVVAASVLEYVAEPDAVLRECARVLRPGGVLLYTVPDLRRPVRWVEWLAQRIARVMRAPSGGGRQSRWFGYHTYLRASRQRHRVQWWLAASGTAGLGRVPFPADCGQPTLRLLAFRRADDRATEPLAPLRDGWRVRQ